MPPPGEKPFRPRPGKPGNRGSRFNKRVLKKLQSLSLGAGALGPRPSGVTFIGERAGRGHWIGRSYQGAFSGTTGTGQLRRVIIKSRIVKLSDEGHSRAVSHLRYIERDGTGAEGREAKGYDKGRDGIELDEFQERYEEDRHQFRFIISPEDADRLENLQSFTRSVMARMAQDLRTDLDWVAVDHHDTRHPHTHVILRGVDDQGKDLMIARSYMAHGMRNAATELLTRELGLRTDMEILRQTQRQIEQDRFTDLDRDILDSSRDHIMHPDAGRFSATLVTARLKKLSRMGLARPLGDNYWRLEPELKKTLQAMGEKGDIIKTMHRNLRGVGRENLQQRAHIFDADDVAQKRLTGELLGMGLSDELRDGRYLILDGADGNNWYVDIGEDSQARDLKPGMIITVEGPRSGISLVDRQIADIARRNGGIYSEALHHDHDPQASRIYIRSHVRRLEGLRRHGIGERHGDSRWTVPPNFADQVKDLHKKFSRTSPVSLTINSRFALDQLVESEGYSWLDRNILGKEAVELSSTGFGGRVQEALASRRAWLLRNGLVRESGDRLTGSRNLPDHLTRRELAKVGIFQGSCRL